MDTRYKIISIGRSLVDVIFTLDDKKYNAVQDFLKVKPGDWTEIKSISQLKKLFKLIDYAPYPIALDFKKEKVDFVAGSTNLNVFSTFPECLRKQSAIITAVGTNKDGEYDKLSILYANSLRKMSITHVAYSYIGYNPLSMVFVSYSNPEKIMASFLGISGNLCKVENIKSQYLYIDAYELVKDPISLLINDLILSQRYKIILGLGNSAILNGKLLDTIRMYIQKGNIYILCGNIFEYAKISGCQNVENILSYKHFSKIEYLLLTRGKDGLIGRFNGNIIYQNAFPIPQIVNTTGAGDVVTGCFIYCRDNYRKGSYIYNEKLCKEGI